MLNHGHQVVSFFLYLCSLFFLLIPVLLTFLFVSLVERGLKDIWKVVDGDESSKYKPDIYMTNLSF